MKPTKEQIMTIGAKIIKERIDLLQSCGLPKEEISERINVADIKDDIETAIAEWEKIRGEIEKIDHLNAPVKYKEIYINNAKKEDENI